MKIKFLCLNLWLGGILFEPVLDFIKAEKPDILALQEVYEAKDPGLEKRYYSITELQKILPGYYYSFAPAFLENIKAADGGTKSIECGNAIFSKFPIVDSGVEFFDQPFRERYHDDYTESATTPRNIQHVQIDLNGKELNVFNTQGIWGLDGGDTERRLKMSESIINLIKDRQNVVLAGDFNVKEKTKTIGDIENHLVNVFKNERVTSFNMRRKELPGFATAVVDFIFTSPNLKISSHSSPDLDVSDHLPLLVEFE